jgi:hypothetical protein
LEPNEGLDGDIGAAFALGTNVGAAISAANASAAIRAFMIRLHCLDIVVIFCDGAAAGRRIVLCH